MLKLLGSLIFLCSGAPLVWAGSTVNVAPGLNSISVTAPLVSSGGGDPILSIPVATSGQNGYLASSDFSNFAAKQSVLSFNSPLLNTAGTISIPVATSSVNGYLSSSDWTTFNGKQASGNYITALTSDVTASGPGSVAATVNSVGGSSSTNVHAAELLANASTATNTASTIPRRNGSGGFSMGALVATALQDSGLSSGHIFSDGSGNLSSYTELVPANSLHTHVSKGGNDTTGDGSILKPYLTVTKALSTLASACNTTGTTIDIGPGQFNEAALALTSNTRLVGQGREATRIVIAGGGGNMTFDTHWSACSSVGGLVNLTFGTNSGILYDSTGYAIPPANVFDLTDTWINGDLIFHGADQNQDFLDFNTGWIFGNLTMDGVTANIDNAYIVGLTTTSTVSAHDGNFDISASELYGGLTATSTGGHVNWTSVLNTSWTDADFGGGGAVTESGAGTILWADTLPADSLVTFSSGTFVAKGSALATAYTPTTSANWSTVPTAVKGALDTLASGIIPFLGAGSGAATSTNVVLEASNGHIKATQTTAPTATVNANAGTGAACSVSHASDVAGSISLTTTAVASASGVECAVNFNRTYGVAPICVLTPTNANAANDSAIQGTFLSSTTAVLNINFATADLTGRNYTWNYHCTETQ